MKDKSLRLPLAPVAPPTDRPISLAILAMGGQGGGVLTDWIVALAESQGWVAQSTSVPGVAQRTGATIYYVETMPPLNGRKPILSLMPTPGDVDIVIAAEFMEAGRSILRGLVTPDRTVLIASNHRAFATVEKVAPGDGVADSSVVARAIGVAARSEIIFDMDALAARNGSVISAALFGALARSGALPFPIEAFRATIAAGGKGQDSSLRAFTAAFERAGAATSDAAIAPAQRVTGGAASALPARQAQAIDRDFPEAAGEMIRAGLARVIDFQDAAYGDEYLALLGKLRDADAHACGAAHNFAFTATAAKYLANAMAYDDVIRVADLKTRAARRARVEAELRVTPSQALQTTEYLHPRGEELIGMLPVGLARKIEARPKLAAWIDRRVNKGRRVKTYTLTGFLTLYAIAGLHRARRSSLRHATETAHRDAWLARAAAALAHNYDLGVEILKCRRLIKGYSDTHARGLSKFDRVMSAIARLERRDDAADWARRLREAAIRDADGKTLDGALRTIESFA